MPVHPPVAFTYLNGVHPVSPLYINTPTTASSFGMISPLLPTFEQQRGHPKNRKTRHHLALAPPLRPEFEYNVHRVVDGSTLCERELPVLDEAQVTDASPAAGSEDAHVDDAVQPSNTSEGNLFVARSIIRPLSTPPASSGTMRIERVRGPYCFC